MAETRAANRAKKISEMIRKTDTDSRACLYREVATELRKNGQAFTAKGFDVLAVLYERGLY